MTEQTTSDENSLVPQDGRKPYVAPVLITHGTIQELTQTLAGDGSDNAQVFPNGSTV